MENRYTPKGDKIAKMLKKDTKDTIYYILGMIGIVIIPISIYITY